jgi:hypothetical protein
VKTREAKEESGAHSGRPWSFAKPVKPAEMPARIEGALGGNHPTG